VAGTRSDTLLDAKAEWLWCLQAEGKSPATLGMYGSAVQSLVDHAGNRSHRQLSEPRETSSARASALATTKNDGEIYT
jgi:hypothetical protein